MERPAWAPDEVDMARPSVARVYDYYLGGSHNFDSDRRFAGRVLEVLPEMAAIAQQNRAFLRRAVRHLCEQGIDQFLDLGSGIPTAGNVHEIAAGVSPGARVLYVDHDPVAVMHSRALLDDVEGAEVMAGDLTDPRGVLGSPAVAEHLDLSKPVAVLLVSVLHFVDDDRRPAEVVSTYMGATAPGSHLVLSHASIAGNDGAADAEAVYNQQRSPNPMRMRSQDEVTALFGDLTLVDPGVVRIPSWRPDSPAGPGAAAESYPGLAGVAYR
ncbi:S-adenosyl methyltransferase [Pseudonocardia sediminis]|uniref:S-adenosyl methyltransferase n=1 Tax=Pseudonocardia sediminis TaxID=1397368 RepID=A0A4Q7UXT6_PSEST|nr:SAM-dependent methyltransferase [Pseudonocardia sediminis]RZT86897.1 S-adenosyl methyltransferase [Pseudonocardia sediminis]